MHKPQHTPRTSQEFGSTAQDMVMIIAEQAIQAVELSTQGGAGVLGRMVGTSDKGNEIFACCVVGPSDMVRDLAKAFGSISKEICEKYMGPPDLVKIPK